MHAHPYSGSKFTRTDACVLAQSLTPSHTQLLIHASLTHSVNLFSPPTLTFTHLPTSLIHSLAHSLLCRRFLLISVREGTQPTNQLWYVDLQALPGFDKDAALDFTPYDYNSGPKALPVVKLVDDFEAAYEYVANEGMTFTFQTNYQAPLYR